MKTKHTLGPWHVKDHPTETCQIIAENSIRVCDVWCTDLEGGVENAHLIAAAPEMLEALQNIIEYRTPVPDTESDYVPRTIIKEAKKAILKALKG